MLPISMTMAAYPQFRPLSGVCVRVYVSVWVIKVIMNIQQDESEKREKWKIEK